MALAPPTPTSPLPFEGFSETLANSTTVVEASPPPYNNTKEIIVFNPSAGADVYMKIVDLTSGLPAAGTVTAATSTLIPPGGSLTLAIGPEGDRQPLGTVAFWAAGNGSNLGIVFKQTLNVSYAIQITYVQTVGGFTGPS